MFLGAALNPFSDELLSDQVDAYANAGFSYVDLAFDYPLTPENFDAPRFGKNLDDLKLGFCGQTPVLLPFASPYANVRAEAVKSALAAIDVLTGAGARNIVLHPDNAYSFLKPEQLIAFNVESFQAIREARPDVQFLIENLHTGIFNRTQTMNSALDCLPGFKIVLDVGHVLVAAKKQGSSMDDWLSLPIAHMHWSENDGLTDQHAWHGGGSMPWNAWFGQFQGRYDGTATIEIYRGLSQDTIAAKAFLEKLL
ncbi:sugar phosphate isomerase/epimerase [Candidatus Micrarchaeota archaeon]|nr:sugar phosphate isomerase/epimerase [Candidatus Micrarchaeota archaeon]